MLKMIRETLPRLLAALLLGSLVAACNPDGGPQVNSPATDPGIPTVAASFASANDANLPQPAPGNPSRSRTAEDNVAEETVVAEARQGRQPRATRTSASGRYYIEFRSRSALSYGHTFAMFGRLNADGSIATREVAGLHPATESPVPWMIGHILPVVSETGASDGDLEDKYTTSRHRVVMDKARYDEMVAYIRNLQASSPMWHAVLYNCNAFVGDIARHMGLTPPGNTMLFPQEYIDELRALNRS